MLDHFQATAVASLSMFALTHGQQTEKAGRRQVKGELVGLLAYGPNNFCSAELLRA